MPDGGVTVAVLSNSPGAEHQHGAMPAAMKMTELPGPTAMLTMAVRLSPEPLPPLVTLAEPVVLEVQVTPVRAAGIMSATLAPTASLGPLLVTVTV